ncbi:hypothetical protein RI367_006477 [Sorochytrium milnesiophthora]
MALNWAIFESDGVSPLALPGEKIYSTFKGIRLEYESGNGFPGAGGNYYVKVGVLHLTSHRLVYVAVPPQSYFTSLSVPLKSIENLKLNRPWFGTDFLHMTVQPVPGAGLQMPGDASFYFHSGGAFECYSMFTNIVSKGLPDVMLTHPHIVPADEPLPLYVNSEAQGEASSSVSAVTSAVPSSSSVAPATHMYAADASVPLLEQHTSGLALDQSTEDMTSSDSDTAEPAVHNDSILTRLQNGEPPSYGHIAK